MTKQYVAPAGFKPFGFQGKFNAVLGQVYSKEIDGNLVVGFFVTEDQLNSQGICHGGALMTFADIVLACIIVNTFDNYVGVPTINLNVDFLALAEEGMWLQTSLNEFEMAYKSGFITAAIVNGDKVILHASGRYKIPQGSRAN